MKKPKRGADSIYFNVNHENYATLIVEMADPLCWWVVPTHRMIECDIT